MNLKSYKISELRSLKCELIEQLKKPELILDHPTIQKRLVQTQTRINELIELAFGDKKDKSKPELNPLVITDCLAHFNNITGHKIRIMDDKAQRQLKALMSKDFVTGDFVKAVQSAFKDMTDRDTVKYLTPEFITRPAEFSKYLNMKVEPKKSLFIPA